ncbi:MAG: hypothetical protein WEA58_12140 [Balneolaceae bacterium]
MNTFKGLLSKLSIIVFAVLFAAGCATVTDANIDAELPTEPTVETTSTDNGDWFSEAGDSMDPIIEKRDTGDDR